MNDLAETARLIAERARPEVAIMSANQLTRELGYLAGIVADLADRLSPPSSKAGVRTDNPPVLGSVERLTQELAAALARNADLQEQIDSSGQVRARLLELLFVDPADDGLDEGEDALTLLNRYAEDTQQHATQLAGIVRDVLDAVYPEKAGKPWHVGSPGVQGLAGEVKTLREAIEAQQRRIDLASRALNPPPF